MTNVMSTPALLSECIVLGSGGYSIPTSLMEHMTISKSGAGSTPPQPIQTPDWRNRKFVFLLVSFFLLLSTLSFGLGYLFGAQKKPAPIIIEKCSDAGTPR